MLQRFRPPVRGRRERIRPRACSLCLLLLALSVPPCAPAQSSKRVTLTRATRITFKLKLAQRLNSGRIRIGDIVLFDLLEDVKVEADGGGKQTLIAKGTPVYGQIVDRSHRFTIVKKGGFGVGKLWTYAVDGHRIDLDIARARHAQELADPARLRAEQDEAQRAPGVRKNECRDKTLKKQERVALIPCVRGRTYAGTFISSLPSAFLAAAATTLLTRVKDDQAGEVVGLTLLGQFGSQQGFSNLVNGVDAEMDAGEVFDATTNISGLHVVKLLGWADESKMNRLAATPAGHVVTNYFSDVVKYPPRPGGPAVYTGKVTENYTEKPVGARMNICLDEPLPPGWEFVENASDPKICPREPGDDPQPYTYKVIERRR